MPTPSVSPTTRTSPLPADASSLHQNLVAGSSRPRRRVAMYTSPGPAPGSTSSSDEEDGIPRPASSHDHESSHPQSRNSSSSQSRNSSLHSVTQHKTSPTSRISSIVQSSLNFTHTPINRSIASSGDISTVSSLHSHTPSHHPDSSASTPPHRRRSGGESEISRVVGSASSRLRQRDNRAGVGQGNFHPTGHDTLDPDSNYYQRFAHLDDSGSETGSEDTDLRLDELPIPLGSVAVENGQGNPFESYRPAFSPSVNALEADSKEGHERLEWQSMLASVLAGDVLRAESTRQGLNEPTKGGRQKALGQSIWWQIRARMRGRTEDEERRRVEDRRGRIVDSVLEELDAFHVKKPSRTLHVERRLSSEDDINRTGEEETVDPEDKEEVEHEEELSALDQVNYMLEKLSLIEALYPHHAAFAQAKPLFGSEKFQARVNSLSAWSTIVHQLQIQLSILQKWTGSDDLDITRPNTTKERALVAKNRYHPLDTKAKAQSQLDMVADDSTFLERVMKEDNLQRTFEKRIFVDIMSLVLNAKETVILYLPSFVEIGLPDFQYELIRLIGFPGRLIIEALKTRLDAAAKLVDPSPMVINDMIDNFRLSISLAVIIKRQYDDVVSPDPEKRWKIPPCMAPDYDEVLLEGLRTFFKLLHWKLKSGNRAMYFKETEVLEDEWQFLYEAAEAVEGGDLVVAESFCSLTNKLMVRISNFFETQLNVPMRLDPKAPPKKRRDLTPLQPDMESRKRVKKQMTPDEMLLWYGKILEAVKMRYRKLQRFAWRLASRHDNSAEYKFSDDNLDAFVQQMQDTGHFLVFTRTFEDHGTYILADGSLWENPAAVKQLLQRAFASSLPTAGPRHTSNHSDQANDHPESPGEEAMTDDLDSVEDDDLAGYLLLLSPCENFAWTGAVMLLDVDYFDLELRDNRIRLVADGPTSRLEMCKNLFIESLLDAETGEAVIPVEMLVEAQAHLPRVQRELKKIARSTQRLNESIIQSAAQVRKSLEGSPGTQEMVQNWFAFASDHGRRVQSYVSASSWPRFSRLCMRLAISWVAFICDSCDPTDRRTFRWTVNALRTAYEVTGGKNILHLDPHEFALLRKSVAALVSFLILHFDILGAKSSVEAKREAERAEAMRRLQRLQEDYQDDFLPRNAASIARGAGMGVAERSIRLVREERLRLIAELDQARVGVSNDQHMIGQVLDEQVSEDRALVFLAASSSNIALRWQQGAFIGGGANGNVYIGFNLDSGGIMAVKEIRVQDLSNSPTLYKQIKDESDVMSMLSHPNIVEYYGIEVHRDRVYIFEEYCEGGSLANLLEHGRVEDEEVIMVYALQMLQGLEYLHARGIEHRDVKPDNILLGTNSQIKFVDFGAAKVIAKGNKTMARTRVANRTTKAAPGPEGPAVMNSLAGTPMYMAPEVIKNEKSGRLGSSDIWSMGCCLLEIVTGRKPWSNLDNEWAIMFHIGIATQHPPLPDPSQMSDLGIDFIEQCVTLDPTDRPSAVELIKHPWLTPMVDAMASHAHGENSYSGSGSGSGSYNSGQSTLVDSLDSSGQPRSNSYDSKLDSTEEEGQGDEGYYGDAQQQGYGQEYEQGYEQEQDQGYEQEQEELSGGGNGQ